nr:glycine zipper family protein [Nitrosomonas nitrosa]
MKFREAKIKNVMLASVACVFLFSNNLFAGGFLDGLMGGNDVKDKAVKEKQSEDRIKGTGLGAIIGGATGALLGKDDKDRLQKGAIGATIGGTVGLVVGNEVANRRGSYSKEHDAVEEAIAATDSKISKIEQDTARIELSISSNHAEISRLTQKNKLAQADIERAKAMLDQIGNDIKANNDLILDTRTQLKLVTNDITKIEELIAAHPDDQGLTETKDKLVARRTKLTGSLNSLNGITPDLVAQRNSLNSIAGTS